MTAVTEEAPAQEAAPQDAAPAAPPAAAPSTDLAIRRPQGNSIPAKLAYARELANSLLLPPAYRRQPANVLYAVEYGEMLGIPPMAAITGIHIIDGKPTASAGLISGLVRKAGHKMRIGYDAANMTGWAEIIRADDPGYTFRSEWNLDRAVTAELCTIKNGVPYAVDSKGRSLPWRKFFPSMTKHRATTEVARDACEEILFGLHYTPEELGAEVDEDGAIIGVIVPDGLPATEGGTERLRGTPGDDPFYVRENPAAVWAREAMDRARAFADDKAGQALWAEVVAKVHGGELPMRIGGEIQAVIKERWRVLGEQAKAAEPEPAPDAAGDAEVVDAEIVYAPEGDEWAEAVAAITSEDDAERLIREVEGASLAEERRRAVLVAITQKLAALSWNEAA